MGCGTVSKAENPRPQPVAVPTILESASAEPQETSEKIPEHGGIHKSLIVAPITPEPHWKAVHYNRQLALLNLETLATAMANLEKLEKGQCGLQDLLEALDPLYHHYYGVINAGVSCPFMSAEEVVEYFKLTGALFGRMHPRWIETLGGASQIHAICEIFEFLDVELVPIDASDILFREGTVRELVNAFYEVSFPHWIKARMFVSDTAAKSCLVTGRQWGLQETSEYKAALEKLLCNAEGVMHCRFDDINNCRITGATRVVDSVCRSTGRDVVRVDFQYSGDKQGPACAHDPSASVLGWDEDAGSREMNVNNVQITEDTDTTIVGSIEFHNVPTTVPNRELWFRFGGNNVFCYSKTYLNFDHPDAKLLPKYWNRTILFPATVTMGAGLSLRKSENLYRHVMGAEHQAEIGKNFLAYNMFCTETLSPAELGNFQKLFDTSFRKKFTRDRKDGAVPDRLLITRGHRCQNVQNWVQYSRMRWQIRQELKAEKGLARSIDNLKTAGIFPGQGLEAALFQDKYKLDVDAHEEFLFHGTNDSAAESITKGDFLVNLAGSHAGTLYGKGVYLAESVSKSDEYTKENARGERCILVCRATLGYVNYTDQVSPNVDALVDSCVNGPYHCVLGDREKCRGTYREIIVYEEDQVYPEYVIWYKRVYEDH